MNIPLFKVFMPPEAKGAMEETLSSGFLAEGPKVKAFSNAIAEFIGNPNVVPVSSCTMALTIAYRLAGVSAGKEVISTPLTCIAGNEPIVMLGGKVVWADVDPDTGMITADTIEPLITDKTVAIYLLHKEGSPAEIEKIYALAKHRNLKVIEDAAHAFGAERRGEKIGLKGDYVCFSFQAIKHITTGDGGALLCADEDDYLRAKKLKWFGVDRDAREGRDVWHEDIPEWGFKCNMNDIAGTLGLAQMAHVKEILGTFHRNGRRYDEELNGVPGVELFKRDSRDFQTYWGYSVLVEKRDQVSEILKVAGIQAMQIHTRNDIYSMFRAEKTALPNTDAIDRRELALPCGWWVNEEMQDYIIATLKKAVA